VLFDNTKYPCCIVAMMAVTFPSFLMTCPLRKFGTDLSDSQFLVWYPDVPDLMSPLIGGWSTADPYDPGTEYWLRCTYGRRENRIDILLPHGLARCIPVRHPPDRLPNIECR
jgi:hypothetical protein